VLQLNLTPLESWTVMFEPREPKQHLSLETRAAAIERMSRESFDLAVIGGGITGAGIALDAASRGLSVALIEKRDFASGTSSRSSKLIHGGLRYLEHFEFALVREALLERATLNRLAPHLSEPLEFLVPLYDLAARSPLGNNRLKLKLGLWLYDLLAGRQNIGRHRWAGKEEVLQLAPRLDQRGLRGGFVYYDCLTNDSRLVIEVIKAAGQHGAAIANYASARGLLKDNGRVSGVDFEDTLIGRRVTLRAGVVVNATGVWADDISRLDKPGASKKLRPSKGIHVVMPAEKLENRIAVLIPSLGEARFLFVIPWCGRTLIGTTDSDYDGELDDPAAEPSEVSRVVESTASSFPDSRISDNDVVGTFAGLRPLVSANGQSTAEVSRKEEIFESESGLITIIGGKLTTYRHMAERVVDLASKQIRRPVPPGRTRDIPLAGREKLTEELSVEASRAAAQYDVTVELVEHLIRNYGGNFRTVLEIARESPDLKNCLIDGLPHIAAEVVYAARHEMATTVEDFLARRTRLALLDRDHGRSCEGVVSELLRRSLVGLEA
jgi:glycerol-3-phosphate dehydrogenase